MKSIPAIVEPAAVDIELCAKMIIVELAGERDDVRTAERHEDLAAKSRESARSRRHRIGAQLCKARGAWPERGPKAKGWGEFLARVKLDDATARRYMEEYRDPEGFAQKRACERNVDDGGSGDDQSEVGIERDTWCTPRWITEAIGGFDLDPCSNERSTVKADDVFTLDRHQDGLVLAPRVVSARDRVFINPPYSDVPPWVAAYKHARFCFLLKLDTSTRWFAELYAATELILIPRKRINFEPPPGVPAEKAIAQQFPHALFYAYAEDATAAIRELCWHWRIDRSLDCAQPHPAALHVVR